jgi:chorismate mutase/prephenate dehydratase
MAKDDNALTEARKKIDNIDYQIHDLLNERAVIALEVAKVKINQGGDLVNFHRPEREAEILKKVAEYNKGPLSDEAVTAIFRDIMATCRQLQIDSHSELN